MRFYDNGQKHELWSQTDLNLTLLDVWWSKLRFWILVSLIIKWLWWQNLLLLCENLLMYKNWAQFLTHVIPETLAVYTKTD